ncbi:hypothetical protein ABTH81_23130, partial [Acinetobacter baumannii]
RVDVIGALIDHVAAEAAPSGCAIERIAGRDGMGDHLLLRVPGGTGRGILCVGHLDTVCAPGSLPMRRDGDRFYGPGIA